MMGKKILQFELSEHVGGIENFLRNLVSANDSEEISFDIVAGSASAVYKDWFKKRNVSVLTVNKHNIFLYIAGLVRLFKFGKYDTVQFNKNSAANIVPLIVAKCCKVENIVVESHNTNPSMDGRLLRMIHRVNRPIMRLLADKTVACSSEAGAWLFGNSNYEVIPNGINTNRFLYSTTRRNEYRNRLGIANSSKVLLAVGRMTNQKNHQLLITTLAELVKDGSDYRLVFVGDGPERATLESLVERYHLEQYVDFLGLRDDVPELLNMADCFVMPSLYEGLPISAIEAQAAGCTVILSDQISTETDIVGKVTWFTLSKGVSSLLKAIESCDFINDKNQRIRQNCMVAESDYSAKRMFEKFEKIYAC